MHINIIGIFEWDFSVAVAVADVFSKNYHSIPNKIDKILKIFDRLDNVKSQGVIFYT